MVIGGLQKLTLIDYPKQVACTVFLRECNFRCPWCYSPELVLPQFFNSREPVEEEQFFRFLDLRKRKLDAVVICGGEPTISDGLFDFIEKIKRKGFLIKLDSNGSQPAIIAELIEKELINYVAVDIKHRLDSESYYRGAGVNVNTEDIKKTISLLLTNDNVDYEFRTTVVPSMHTVEDVESIARSIKGAKKYFLQNFYPKKTIDSSFLKKGSFSNEEMDHFCQVAKKYVQFCQAR